ncbi:hypothetical protein LX86_001613 [Lentzea aerocolonigenes]|nr:hypothetical protein [Lentzea aerocolonigenes]
MQMNTLDYLFECLDALDKVKRDEITGWLWEAIIRPRVREPIHDEETLADLRIDPVNYEVFKQKCYTLKRSSGLDDMFIVSLIVSFLLQATFGHGDTTSIDQKVARNKDMLDFMAERERKVDPAERERLAKFRVGFEQRVRELPDRIKEGYKLYVYLCENVVSKLLEERPLF